MTDPDNAGGRQAGGRFARGQSGNPAGMARGSQHRATKAALALLDGEAESLTRKAVELAQAGDTTALRLCLERLIPPRRDRPITFRVDPINGPQDALTTMARIVAEMGEGEITPSEAAAVMGVVNGYLEAWKATDLEARLAALEAKGAER